MNTVPVEFKTVYPGVGKEPFDMVLVAPRGDAFTKQQTWHRISSIRPPENPSTTLAESESYKVLKARWSVIEPAYMAWKKGNDLPEDGTPLEAWGGVTRDQVDHFKKMGIRTVEHVRDMDDATIQSVPFPNARKLPQLAGEYLKGSDAAAKDRENQELKERIAAMEEMLAEATQPKKRGRPPKKEAEAA